MIMRVVADHHLFYHCNSNGMDVDADQKTFWTLLVVGDQNYYWLLSSI